MKDESQRSKADLLKEIAKLKVQRSRLNVRIRKLTDAANAFVHYIITPRITQGTKLHSYED